MELTVSALSETAVCWTPAGSPIFAINENKEKSICH